MCIDLFVNESYNNMKCDICKSIVELKLTTNVQPENITVSIPKMNRSSSPYYKIGQLDMTVILNDIKYDLLCATYGDDLHFISRYI